MEATYYAPCEFHGNAGGLSDRSRYLSVLVLGDYSLRDNVITTYPYDMSRFASYLAPSGGLPSVFGLLEFHSFR